MMDDRDERLKKIILAKQHNDAQYLIEALQDDENRTIVIRYLEKLKAKEAIPAIIRVCRVSDPGTRAIAICALGKLAATEALPTLSEIAVSDPVNYVRTWAIDSVARIDRRLGVKMAFEAIESNDDRLVKRAAIVMVKKYGDKSDAKKLRPYRKITKENLLIRYSDWSALRAILKERKPRD